ncbi:hypothetical protein TWF506_002554 [Arthrobotrys conoides]|uniref:Uncharacterized protein n=1 Tax=Arthrobotrys conoides TaxID=74498 RepID=A0AAN8RRJ7_9PEZI
MRRGVLDKLGRSISASESNNANDLFWVNGKAAYAKVAFVCNRKTQFDVNLQDYTILMNQLRLPEDLSATRQPGFV